MNSNRRQSDILCAGIGSRNQFTYMSLLKGPNEDASTSGGLEGARTGMNAINVAAGMRNNDLSFNPEEETTYNGKSADDSSFNAYTPEEQEGIAGPMPEPGMAFEAKEGAWVTPRTEIASVGKPAQSRESINSMAEPAYTEPTLPATDSFSRARGHRYTEVDAPGNAAHLAGIIDSGGGVGINGPIAPSISSLRENYANDPETTAKMESSYRHGLSTRI
jgi:hypothetical protein